MNPAPMRLFACNDFEGLYPVPVAAVIVAKNEEEAKEIFKIEFEKLDYVAGRKYISKNYTIKEIQTDKPVVVFLSIGEY